MHYQRMKCGVLLVQYVKATDVACTVWYGECTWPSRCEWHIPVLTWE